MTPFSRTRKTATGLVSQPPLPAIISKAANRHRAVRLQLDPTRIYSVIVNTNSVDIVPMDERGLAPVTDSLGHVAVNYTTCFTFRIDAVRTHGQNRPGAEPNFPVLSLVTSILQRHMGVVPIRIVLFTVFPFRIFLQPPR